MHTITNDLIFEDEEIINFKNYFRFITWQQSVSFSVPTESKLVYKHLIKISEVEKLELFNNAVKLYGNNLYKEINLKTSYIFTQYNKISWIYNTITEKINDIIF